MATLRLVARAAGVHVATASAVLNGSTGNTRVSAQTRQRVLDAAKRLAYVRNEMARRLRTGRSNFVGFLGGDLRNPFFAELTAALEGELARFDLQLIVTHSTEPDPTVIDRTMENLRQERVRAIIRWEESAAGERSSGSDIGDATLAIGFTRRERPGVWLDLEFAIETAVKEMARRGFRRLGFFFPRGQRESPSVAARAQSFADSCAKSSGLEPVLASYEGESWDLFSSIRGATSALKEHAQVEAWIGFNDQAALGLLRCLPPEWTSRVLCFDGTTLARCWPGDPTYLDLKIPDFTRAIASVVAGKLDAGVLGERKNWFRPSLMP